MFNKCHTIDLVIGPFSCSVFIKVHVLAVDLATSCYEHACGKYANNLELMMGLFSCYVREYSYVKQQQVCEHIRNENNFPFSPIIYFSHETDYVSFSSCGCGRQPLKCTKLWVKKGFCFGLFAAFSCRFYCHILFSSFFLFHLVIYFPDDFLSDAIYCELVVNISVSASVRCLAVMLVTNYCPLQRLYSRSMLPPTVCMNQTVFFFSIFYPCELFVF